MKNNVYFAVCVVMFTFLFSCKNNVYNLSEYGIKPNTKENISPLIGEAIEKIKTDHKGEEPIIIRLDKGRYDFYPEGSIEKEYYVSNHDQTNPKLVGIALEAFDNLILDGQGSELIFHGRMLPISLLNSKNTTLKNFSIDFENPHITQVKILENDTVSNSITFEVAPWVQYEIKDSSFVAIGEGWESTPFTGIAFEEKTKHIVYRTSDISFNLKKVEEVGERKIRVEEWKDKRLSPSTVIAMRTYYRPTPGIFLADNIDTRLENIKVHYAEGMGLLAQSCENINLDRFSVCLRGENDPRYFTTQADATHFSGCKGVIVSKNGLYENMMDDAINVHGTYLKITKRIDPHTLEASYMHSQAWGFQWGWVGDDVQFIDSKTMEIIGEKNKVKAIETIDKPNFKGAKVYKITFENEVESEIGTDGVFGIENLEWTPEVIFSDNTIRNNRARGTLFSTPKPTLVENNIFDHTSGTAILLCGDCNGWFETGACTDIIIRNNKFINSLTNEFQFTNAIISIYPEIPNLKDQQKYFHSNILIENNQFETFDIPILYAKSVDGLVFRGNTIKHNKDYPSFHWNNSPFRLDRVVNYSIEDNSFDIPFDKEKDVRRDFE